MENKELEPLPSGDYVIGWEEINERTITFRVLEGKHAGRLLYAPTRQFLPKIMDVTMKAARVAEGMNSMNVHDATITSIKDHKD